ncbi:hypothetical protein [Thioalkalivibrio thiocyanodenitrificans]|uniref:hypothetical protein n=1 Tax=Thioalkalivibrio thiocyanodenitrificans TaxID=243063 RepID=UPI00036037BA|nr:hypothetical protein [Thioalkalivibrio thiocyanodenitrificans]
MIASAYRKAPRPGDIWPPKGKPSAQEWTVARFPDGSWTTGGRPDDPDYAQCELFIIEAPDRGAAIMRAQAKRRRQARKANG